MNSEWGKGKVLAQIGGILSLPPFLFVSLLFTFAYLFGLFFQIFGIKKIAKEISENKVFYFYLVSIFLKILTIVVSLVGLYFILGKVLFLYGLTQGFSIELAKGALPQFIFLIIICWFLISLSGFFYFKTFKKIGQRTNVDYFSKGAKISFLGCILYIFIIGYFLDLLGQLFVLAGYFLLPKESPLQSS